MTPTERFWSHVDVRGPDECWPWTASLMAGYGRLGSGYRLVRAHRFSYELHVGPIPVGMTIDHECHNRSTGCPGGNQCPHRACVNPAHLSVATAAENTRRSPLRGSPWRRLTTHCKHGHEFTPANTRIDKANGHRVCRACCNERTRGYNAIRPRGRQCPCCGQTITNLNRHIRARHPLFTAGEQTATRVDTKALRDAEPDVAAKYSTTTTSRVLRVAALKEPAT